MEGREFLAVAEALLEDERLAFRRTSIGRSYYAAYLEARTFCERHLGFIRTASSREHQTVPTLLATVDPALASTLKFLRAYRNAADYDIYLSASTVVHSTEDAIVMSRTMIAMLDAHSRRMEDERRAASLDDEADGDAPTTP